MLTIDVDLRGVQGLRHHREAMVRALTAWHRDAAVLVQRSMSLEIRRQQRSFGRKGRLANSVRVTRLGVGDFTVGPEAPHAKPFILGSGLWGPKGKKFPIKPRFKKALAFAVTGGGVARMGTTRRGTVFSVLAVQGPLLPGGKRRTVRGDVQFAKGVMHPGNPPHDVLTPTARTTEPLVNAMLRRHVDHELTRIAGEALRSLGGA